MKYSLSAATAAVEYVEDHLGEDLCLDEIARATQYSKFHLHRRFSDAAGITVREYSRRRRLTEAAKMLICTDKRIIDIATECGFTSQQAFSDSFKRAYKITPYQFRLQGEYYPLQLALALKEPLAEGSAAADGGLVRFAEPADMGLWMELVGQVIDGYPCFDGGEYRKQLQRHVARKEALVLDCGACFGAAIAFDRHRGSVDFFGVHPQLRGSEALRMLLGRAIREFDVGIEEISTTTFREGDTSDTGYRRQLLALGFREAEFLVEYGYPTQRLAVHRAFLEEACDV